MPTVVVTTGLYILWVLLPLIPAILLYKIFPNQKIILKGPLAGLTIAASGAFAGYLAIFLISVGIAKTLIDQQLSNENATVYWLVTAPIRVLDEHDRPMPYRPDKEVSVSITPIEYRVGNDEIFTYVKKSSDGYFPTIQVHVLHEQGKGAPVIAADGHVDLWDNRTKAVVNEKNRTIDVQLPIVVRPFKGTSIGGGE